MLNIISFFFLLMLITNLLMMICLVISKKSFYERDKLSSFECGFNQHSSSRKPFSLRFFLITILFLIFDVEIALIFSSIYNFSVSSSLIWFALNNTFLLILFFGLLHEWNQGILEWSI